jgi:hypothetical protein
MKASFPCFIVFCRFAPFGYLYFSYFSMNEPELGAGIDLCMAFNPFPSSILDETRFEPTTMKGPFILTDNIIIEDFDKHE